MARLASQVKTLTFTVGPISVPAYGVATQPAAAPSPGEDGYVVGMKAEIEAVNIFASKVYLMKMTIPGMGEAVSGFDGTNAWTKEPTSGARVLTGADTLVMPAILPTWISASNVRRPSCQS